METLKPFKLRRVKDAVADLATAVKTARDLTVGVIQHRAPMMEAAEQPHVTVTALSPVEHSWHRAFIATGWALDHLPGLVFVPERGGRKIAAEVSHRRSHRAMVVLAEAPEPDTTYAVCFPLQHGIHRPTGVSVSIPPRKVADAEAALAEAAIQAVIAEARVAEAALAQAAVAEVAVVEVARAEEAVGQAEKEFAKAVDEQLKSAKEKAIRAARPATVTPKI